MEEAVYYILSALTVTATLFISAIHSEDTTEGERLYPLPKETPAPPLTIESVVIGPFRIWHIVGFCAVALLIIMVIVCCCVDVRIPRTKEEIEESYQKRILNKQFTKDMNNPFGPYSRSDEPPKRLPNRIPLTNPAFTSDDADIIYASEPRKTQRALPQRSESLQTPAATQVSRNPSSVSNIYDYQIQQTDDVSTSKSNISNYSRKKNQASFNGSADIENSQNFQRERLANQSSRSQQLAVAPKPRPAARNQRRYLQGYDDDVTATDKAGRTRDKISRIARFGVQTPLANHPAIILGPKREQHEGHPSLAATARTLIAMSPHPGQLGRR